MACDFPHPDGFGGSDYPEAPLKPPSTPVQGWFVVRDGFPSLSLMSRPITPALPRLRQMGKGKWRCRVELRDIVKKKGVSGLSIADYAAPGAEGWGNTIERAYTAWKSKWRVMHEDTP